MYPELQEELRTFERRTAKSAESHKRNLKRIPLGVANNYRAYDPYPIFVKEAHGSHFRTEGYRRTVNKVGLQAYTVSAGANGVLLLYPKEVRNHRYWITIDTDLWRHYWFAMANRGVMPQPHWWASSGPFPYCIRKLTLTSTSQPSKMSLPH
jgi:hypothetical protein